MIFLLFSFELNFGGWGAKVLRQMYLRLMIESWYLFTGMFGENKRKAFG